MIARAVLQPGPRAAHVSSAGPTGNQRSVVRYPSPQQLCPSQWHRTVLNKEAPFRPRGIAVSRARQRQRLDPDQKTDPGPRTDLPLASANSDVIRWSRVLLSHPLDAARSYSVLVVRGAGITE